MKVEEYIRTKDGIIDKVIIEYKGKCASPTCNCKHVSCEKNYYDEDKIIKSSPNIIDLIEVGDYVNGHRVNYINKGREHFNISFGNEDFNLKSKFNSDIYWLSKEDIKSIVTKEQFSQMEYKIGE